MPAERKSIEDFRDLFRIEGSTLHQLRKCIEAIPRMKRFEALLSVFADTSRDPSIYRSAQEMSGELLLALLPQCTRPLDDILIAIAPTWNPSVEAFPFYLSHVFGKEQVLSATANLEQRFAVESRGHRCMGTIRWWLTGAVTFFPSEGTRRLSVDVELEGRINKGSRAKPTDNC